MDFTDFELLKENVLEPALEYGKKNYGAVIHRKFSGKDNYLYEALKKAYQQEREVFLKKMTAPDRGLNIYKECACLCAAVAKTEGLEHSASSAEPVHLDAVYRDYVEKPHP